MFSYLIVYAIVMVQWIASLRCMVEMRRFELLTPCLQGRCSPN